MLINRTSLPDILPVTPEVVMSHAVVEDNDLIDIIKIYISATTAHGQNITGRQFVETSFECLIDEFPSDNIYLLSDVQSVASVEYTDEDGNGQTLDSAEYTLNTNSLINFLEPVDDWPEDTTNVKVTFNAGYPMTDNKESTTPNDIIMWILTRVSGFIEQKESFVLSKGGRFGIANMPRDFVDSYLDEYIVPGIGSGV